MSNAAAVSAFDPNTFSVSWGVSPEADKIRDLEAEYRSDLRGPVSFAWRDSLVEQIADIVQTCSDPSWDGYDAEPASRDSARCATELARNLPEGIQAPAVVPDPDGDIAFEWRTDDNRLFSLSVTGPTLVYAGRFGGSSRQYGEEPFFGAIPRTILGILAKHFPAS
jgi:hypothetical protein